MRYLKLKLELSTLEQELNVMKKKYNQELYSGCHNLKGIDYAQAPVLKETKDINTFYQDFISLSKEISVKEEYKSKIENALESMEKDFKEYAEEFNDVEMKLFVEMYIYGKRLNQVLIRKNSQEYYSLRQIKRFHQNLKKKLKNF
ncbi:MAG: hypothetical protein NC182_01690 [Prevotella sp.]|nr:hypothetical protein [Staphylococcus sp.]MCM1349895.1 hypothetical protein [Prevotella sp.]